MQSPAPVRPAVRRKASAAIDSLVVAREMFGEAEIERLIQRLPPETRAICERKLLTVEWLDYAAWFPFNEAIFAGPCGNDELKFRRYARKVAERGFSSVYRMFIKLPSTDFVVDRATKIWTTFFDAGSLRVVKREREGEVRKIVIALSVPLPKLLFGTIVCEVMEQLAGMNGARSVSTTPKLRVVGDLLEGEIYLTYT